MLRLPDDLYEKVLGFQRENKMKSPQEAIRVLIDASFEKNVVDADLVKNRLFEFGERLELMDARQEAWAKELEERLIKTASKGTKASLANLIALSTYLPPIGNIIDSMSHVTLSAWGRLGFEVVDQALQKDQATLLAWREKGPAEFFSFCWAAAGRASRRGTPINYDGLTAGLIDQQLPFEGTEDLPALFYDLLGDDGIESRYGKEFADRLNEVRDLREAIMTRIEEGSIGSLDIGYIKEVDQEYADILEEIRRRENLTISSIIDDNARIKSIESLGLQDPFRRHIPKRQEEEAHSWQWFLDNLGPEDIIEHLTYLQDMGYGYPDGYDGSYDDEIGE